MTRALRLVDVIKDFEHEDGDRLLELRDRLDLPRCLLLLLEVRIEEVDGFVFAHRLSHAPEALVPAIS